MDYQQFLQNNVNTGRISELSDIACSYYACTPSELSTKAKLDTLCYSFKIDSKDIDTIIFEHSAVSRTVKGHAFEVIFDYIMSLNNIPSIEIGGDSDIDRMVNNHTLQLKTPFVNGCTEKLMSYKTHKTHGAKSEGESIDYYHRKSDFADYLVGLVSYHPFDLLIIPKEKLPTVPTSDQHIASPMFIEYIDSPYLNNYSQLSIDSPLDMSAVDLDISPNEQLPKSSVLLDMKSEFILRSIFIKENFRIWDMNMRGFLREHQLRAFFADNNTRVYEPEVTGLPRPEKCDLVLMDVNDQYFRYQVKGLTWSSCVISGEDSLIDCETQLSRGRVNNHPTQSRLYQTSDFEGVIIAIDPPYSNALSKACFSKDDYNWRFYAVPTETLRTHPKYPNRVFSHQRILFKDLQQYLISDDWLKKYK